MHAYIANKTKLSLSTVLLNSRDQQGNVWCINSSVMVSVEKTGNISTGTTLSILKIYSRCLICILKVKMYRILSFLLYKSQLPNGLLVFQPAIRPSSTMARAPVFSHNRLCWIYKTVVLKKVYLQRHDASVLISFLFQITYRKMRNLRIGISKL